VKVFALKSNLKMKKIVLLIFCVFFLKLSYSISPGESNNALLLNVTNNTEINVNKSYQQFKYEVVNFEANSIMDYAYLKKRRRKKDDNLMLYVAGGLAVATATLILTNNPENFTSNSASGVNLGISIGGTIACGMIVAKHFVDKGR
jgi:hypothetical protein